jgi:CheY-like chemotaxis protein/DNA-binding CsgD family transcriptional regulator
MKNELKDANNNIVMIVDDTPENLALLSDTLSESGYRVLVATDGLSALEQIRFLKPDIILLDVMMPGIDGYETCNQLKSNPLTANIPVLFMTALTELDDLLRGFGEGAVDYLVKPIRPPEVLARVDAQLSQARSIQRAESALNSSSFSVLAITPSGKISWLPASGLRWLCEFLHIQTLTETIKVGSSLPDPIHEWVKTQLALPEDSETKAYECNRNGAVFNIKLSRCHFTNEYLLLLDKRTGDWNLDSVRHSLGLTFREAEILMWISRGKTNKEIGLILDSSPRTVNKHLEHIFEKLGVVTRAAAVSIAMQRTSNINTATENN